MGRLKKLLGQQFPYLTLALITKPYEKYRFRNRVEKSVFNGQALKGESSSPSIVFFSLHKCGSSIASKYVKRLALSKGLKHINYSAYVSMNAPQHEETFNDPGFQQRAYPMNGCFFGCFREFKLIPNLEQIKVLLHVRDPRDLLVSHFHSVAFIRTLRQKSGVSLRRKALSMGLDEFVLYQAPIFLQRFKDYQVLLDSPNVLLTKFENFNADPETWIKSVAKHYQLEVSLDLIEDINSVVGPRATRSKKTDHHRKSQPGEYKTVLQKETISKLNAQFKDVLSAFQYEI